MRQESEATRVEEGDEEEAEDEAVAVVGATTRTKCCSAGYLYNTGTTDTTTVLVPVSACTRYTYFILFYYLLFYFLIHFIHTRLSLGIKIYSTPYFGAVSCRGASLRATASAAAVVTRWLRPSRAPLSVHGIERTTGMESMEGSL